MQMAITTLSAMWFLPFAALISIWAAWNDLKFMKIPNVAVLALVAVFLVLVFCLPIVRLSPAQAATVEESRSPGRSNPQDNSRLTGSPSDMSIQNAGRSCAGAATMNPAANSVKTARMKIVSPLMAGRRLQVS